MCMFFSKSIPFGPDLCAQQLLIWCSAKFFKLYTSNASFYFHKRVTINILSESPPVRRWWRSSLRDSFQIISAFPFTWKLIVFLRRIKKRSLVNSLLFLLLVHSGYKNCSEASLSLYYWLECFLRPCYIIFLIRHEKLPGKREIKIKLQCQLQCHSHEWLPRFWKCCAVRETRMKGDGRKGYRWVRSQALARKPCTE